MADGISSANIVGYSDNTMNSGTGFTMAAPTFLTVGSTMVRFIRYLWSASLGNGESVAYYVRGFLSVWDG